MKKTAATLAQPAGPKSEYGARLRQRGRESDESLRDDCGEKETSIFKEGETCQQIRCSVSQQDSRNQKEEQKREAAYIY